MARGRRALAWLVAGSLGACGGEGPPATSPTSLRTGCLPTLVSPNAGAVLDNGCLDAPDRITWDFTWSACPGAEAYHLHVIHAGALVPVIDDPTLTTTSYRYDERAWIGEANRRGWRWRVRSRQQGAWNDWTVERTFDVEPLGTDCPRAAPQQISPPHGSVFSHFPRTLTLAWSAVPGAASYGVEIDCFHCCQLNQWCSDVGGRTTVAAVSSTSYRLEFVGAQPGRWRVWATDAAGRESARSGWWEFRFTF